MIGLILGTGDLPCQIIKKLKEQETLFTCVFFDSFLNNQAIALIDDYKRFQLGYVGEIISYLKQKKVTHVLFAGHIARPGFKDLHTDSKGKMWLVKLGLSIFKGDDGLLVSITQLLEAEGFKVIAADDILDDLHLSNGTHTIIHPSKQDLLDIEKGIDILKATSQLDIGQAVVVEDGLVLGLEAIEGTEKLIQRISCLKRSKVNSGVLVKMAKQNQSKKIDLPTIGPDTVQQCIDSKLTGLAIDSNYTQVLNQERVIRLANENGLFIQAF
ncbi:MAG: hypothetical protein COY39_03595 [Alphaproteobacteria bacterium CG_4_10_14_0_8_um_filter_37_21]|nr:MAG: hypothetical protein COY39_03595 [Alphaproteobacteria bacterium CG_4_10_14_0_8_um_filter_37_21]